MKRGRPANPDRPLSLKQERFVAGLVAGKTQRAAAVAAGFRERASGDLMANPRIQRALEQARSQVRERAAFDADAAFRELNGAIEDAREAKAHMAVVRALELKLKLTGLLIERQAHMTLNLTGTASRLDEAEALLRETSRDYLLLAPSPVSAPSPAVPDIFEDESEADAIGTQ